MARTYSTSVIPGDGIGKEVMPEGIRVLERGASLYGFSIEQTWQDFACCELWPTPFPIMCRDGVRCPSSGANMTNSPGAPDARCALPARGAGAGRHRLLSGPRKYPRGI